MAVIDLVTAVTVTKSTLTVDMMKIAKQCEQSGSYTHCQLRQRVDSNGKNFNLIGIRKSKTKQYNRILI